MHLNLNTMELTNKERMPFARYGHAVCGYHNYIFVCGGVLNAYDVVGFADYYDVITDKWHDLPNLPF